MMKLNCLIVDDEPIAREIIRGYCNQLGDLRIAGECGNALEARQLLQTQKVDILLLDINMPVLDGLSFLAALKDPPAVIFTTAYREHAADAFTLAATDYLVKPFSLERFIQAIDRAAAQYKRPVVTAGESQPDHFFIQVGQAAHRIACSGWRYAEAQGNHTKLVTDEGTFMPYMTFSAFEALLPPGKSIRIHRSFLVNPAKISRVEGNRLFIVGQELPVGTHYRAGLLQALGLR